MSVRQNANKYSQKQNRCSSLGCFLYWMVNPSTRWTVQRRFSFAGVDVTSKEASKEPITTCMTLFGGPCCFRYLSPFADANMPKNSQTKRARDAARKRRAEETPEKRAERLARRAVRMAEKRAEETPGERAERLAKNAARMAKKRARLVRDLRRHMEQVLPDRQQLWVREKNCSLDQEDPEPPQIKEEREEVCISQVAERLVLKQETDAFMSPTHEENDHQTTFTNAHLPKESRAHAAESDEARAARQGSNAVCMVRMRAEKTLEKREELLTKDAVRKSKMRTEETPAKRAERLARNAVRMAEKRAEETPEERAERLIKDAVRIAEKRAEETPEERAERLIKDAVRNAKMRAEETPEKRAERLIKDAVRSAKRRAEETPEKRAKRLARVAAYRAKRRARRAQGLQHQKEKFLPDQQQLCIEERICNPNFSELFEKPLLCETCGKTFRNISLLKIHMAIHKSERPYLCKTCGKDFKVASILKAHMRTHTVRKLCDCKTCGKRLSCVASLKSHMTIHTVTRQKMY
ncbi:zinc finger protein 37-like isoform X2 [Perca fluviatilis]|uniref:zinc finger protein 37-like isoform X2 n=1 Tax=Perca fluviatilis TaxID=8168 RepID=UPI001966B2B5|nr:zinc finger protein 37-like isoform X2 [Perca fluviatilis]